MQCFSTGSISPSRGHCEVFLGHWKSMRLKGGWGSALGGCLILSACKQLPFAVDRVKEDHLCKFIEHPVCGKGYKTLIENKTGSSMSEHSQHLKQNECSLTFYCCAKKAGVARLVMFLICDHFRLTLFNEASYMRSNLCLKKNKGVTLWYCITSDKTLQSLTRGWQQNATLLMKV